MDSQALRQAAFDIRKQLLRMHFEGQAGHLGTGLSSVDVLTYLYGVALRPQDKFILSKGHGASALYATLHRFGVFSDEVLATYYKDGTHLPAHPAPCAFDAIPAATGSLGHGLSIATGFAYAKQKLQKENTRVYTLLSDGDCNEGAVWEAALFAGHHKLSNLTVIVDHNSLQGFGRSEDVLDMSPFADKWKAFGFDVAECDGHDFSALHKALSAPTTELPRCVIAKTIKGKGVSFMEDKLEWHYLPISQEQYARALQDLEAGYES